MKKIVGIFILILLIKFIVFNFVDFGYKLSSFSSYESQDDTIIYSEEFNSKKIGTYKNIFCNPQKILSKEKSFTIIGQSIPLNTSSQEWTQFYSTPLIRKNWCIQEYSHTKNLVWAEEFSAPEQIQLELKQIIESDEGYIILSNFDTINPSKKFRTGVHVIKLNKKGKLLWQKTVGLAKLEFYDNIFAKNIIEKDENILIQGIKVHARNRASYSIGGPDQKIQDFVLKLRKDGKIEFMTHVKITETLFFDTINHLFSLEWLTFG
ncbi:hypothetical protein COV82_00535 [Candidatus Peregrinibacteria bacterium CG11_big_fil_rev_8_21_14_0_20_46_8]|nr:MAG: hypothetical protein COV82_00535 [Candidatus Peregrinibacteria bacterium CG11_big_fil_rev_8_21_14_0_20_46_8]